MPKPINGLPSIAFENDENHRDIKVHNFFLQYLLLFISCAVNALHKTTMRDTVTHVLIDTHPLNFGHCECQSIRLCGIYNRIALVVWAHATFDSTHQDATHTWTGQIVFITRQWFVFMFYKIIIVQNPSLVELDHAASMCVIRISTDATDEHL